MFKCLSISLSKKIFLFIMLGFLVVLPLLNNFAQAQCDPTSGDPMGCIPKDVYTDKSIQDILIGIIDSSLSFLFLVVLVFLIYGGYNNANQYVLKGLIRVNILRYASHR